MKTLTIQQANEYGLKHANILESGIWGVYHFTIGNMEVKRFAIGFLGAGIHRHTGYEIKLNGKHIRTVESFNTIVRLYIQVLINR